MNTNIFINRLIKVFKKQYIFNMLATLGISLIILNVTEPMLTKLSFNYSLKIVDELSPIRIEFNEETYKYIKIVFYTTMIVSLLAFTNAFYVRFLYKIMHKEKYIKWYDIKYPKYPYDKNKLQFVIGLKHNEDDTELNESPQYSVIDEKGLYQNIMCTGTIGQGKTISFLVQFLLQMIYYKYDDQKKKVAMLCLDVKGNFYEFVLRFAKECKRQSDVILIEIGGDYFVNLIHKPTLSPLELAHRMRNVLDLFISENTSSYWIDKAEELMTELIKLIRLYNSGYVTFEEIHNMTTNADFLAREISYLEKKLEKGDFNQQQKYDFVTARNYIENEFNQLDEKGQAYIKSEITRMTLPFISNIEVKNTFCPKQEQINFTGFEEIIEKGKIVVWKVNANKHKKISRLVAAYLKMDFQGEIMNTLELKTSNPVIYERPKITICDEYQTYVTSNDSEFLSQSREPKGITAVAIHSYSSVKKAMNNDNSTKMLLQSFVNKIWMRTDDADTTKEIMNHIGKEERQRVSSSITETSQKSHFNFSLSQVIGRNKNLSTTTNVNVQNDFRFDERFITQCLDAFKAICFISTGEKIIKPHVAHLIPMIQDSDKIFQGRILLKNNKINFITDRNIIKGTLGEVNLSELETKVEDLKESDMLNPEYFGLASDGKLKDKNSKKFVFVKKEISKVEDLVNEDIEANENSTDKKNEHGHELPSDNKALEIDPPTVKKDKNVFDKVF